MSLVLENVSVSVDGNVVIKDLSLTIADTELHMLMGPNGSGKTSVAFALMGHPRYKITQGRILLNGVDITKLPPHERAKKGLFLSFQYPPGVSGVTLSNFLRSTREAVTGEKLSVLEFHKLVKEKLALLKMDSSFLKRYVNEGFSGGEKKRAEMLQLLMLEPKFAILDETDSGLDTDAVKVVAEVLSSLRLKMGLLVITHSPRFLELVQPDHVSVIVEGNLVASGDRVLAREILMKGFEQFEVVQ